MPQYILVAPVANQLRVLIHLLQEHMKGTEESSNYKIILFFPTARQTQFFSTILNSAGMEVLEMHSRKSQAQRTKAAELFR